ncbi:hypothetical protein TELCIR_12094, partial [Teladorsagia circumcincta]
TRAKRQVYGLGLGYPSGYIYGNPYTFATYPYGGVNGLYGSGMYGGGMYGGYGGGLGGMYGLYGMPYGGLYGK